MKKTAFFFFIFFSLSCDKGLMPPGVTSISGKVHFVNSPTDSVNIFAVVVVQPTAPFSAATLIAGYGIYVLPFTLSNNSFRDTNYSINVKPDSTYHYLGIAQNYGYNLLADWRVVAFAHDDKDSAQSFTLKPGEQRTGVDLTVRVDSLPRQPFIK